MIKFFRHIRQRLLVENRFSKYLLYALGEIVLVVIGILIALQINNWNEGRKLTTLEKDTLKELKSNLQADVKDFRSDLSVYRISSNSSDIVMDFIDGKMPYHDSLNIHLGKIPVQGVFSPNKAAYENLKATGINLISNDPLRAAISDLYEGRYHYVKNYMDVEYQFDRQTFGQFYLEEMREYSFFSYAVPIDPTRLVGNQDLRNLIVHRKLKIDDWFQVQYDLSIKKAEQVIMMIDNELGQENSNQ